MKTSENDNLLGVITPNMHLSLINFNRIIRFCFPFGFVLQSAINFLSEQVGSLILLIVQGAVVRLGFKSYFYHQLWLDLKQLRMAGIKSGNPTPVQY